jgi:hypothetical protein
MPKKQTVDLINSTNEILDANENDLILSDQD